MQSPNGTTGHRHDRWKSTSLRLRTRPHRSRGRCRAGYCPARMLRSWCHRRPVYTTEPRAPLTLGRSARAAPPTTRATLSTRSRALYSAKSCACRDPARAWP